MTDFNEVRSASMRTAFKLTDSVRNFGRVAYDGRVTPPTAAAFLGKSLITLKTWRTEKRGPRALYKPLWGHAWSYDITDLTNFKLQQALK